MTRDVSEADFATAVLDRSYEVPVVVDFWAEWCGPCRQLTPILEKVAGEHAGQVELVKVDTDANQTLSYQMGIQGIPAVKAFRDGAIVDEFVGAQPELSVRQFFERLLAMESRRSQRDEVVAAAVEAYERGDLEEAKRLLAQVPADAEVSAILADIALQEAGVDLGDPEGTLKTLLEEVRSGDRDGARERMVQMFEVLGPDHPLTKRYRAELANALF